MNINQVLKSVIFIWAFVAIVENSIAQSSSGYHLAAGIGSIVSHVEGSTNYGFAQNISLGYGFAGRFMLGMSASFGTGDYTSAFEENDTLALYAISARGYIRRFDRSLRPYLGLGIGQARLRWDFYKENPESKGGFILGSIGIEHMRTKRIGLYIEGQFAKTKYDPVVVTTTGRREVTIKSDYFSMIGGVKVIF